MTTEEKKEKIRELTREHLDKSYKGMLENIDKVLNSSAIDIDGWDMGNAPMILPKTILIAVLQYEIRQWTPSFSDKLKRKMNKEIRNISYFL